MTQAQVLEEVLKTLHRLEIRCALTGSHAIAAWGVPRSSHDIDFVVALQEGQVGPLMQALSEGYYCDEQAINEALSGSGHFNLIHLETGIKVDCWLAGDEGYPQQCLERRIAPDPQRPHIAVLSAEDAILAKLLCLAQGAGEHHVADIEGVLRVQRDSLDFDYLSATAERLRVDEALRRIVQSVQT